MAMLARFRPSSASLSLAAKFNVVVDPSLTVKVSATATGASFCGVIVRLTVTVNGAAVGYGMELALLADVRIASTGARFSEMFVKRAIVAGHDSFELLPRMVGPAAAAEILLTGDMVEADRALELGLVSQVVADDELLPAARALAKRITANAPLAVQAAKEAMRLERAGKGNELRAHLRTALGELLASDDHQESVAAFLEHRDPMYKGR